MARTKRSPVSVQDRKVIGGLLRDIRRAAGYRSVESAAADEGMPGVPPDDLRVRARRARALAPPVPGAGGVLRAGGADPRCAGAKARRGPPRPGVAAVTRALTLPAYHVTAGDGPGRADAADLGGKRDQHPHGDRPRGDRGRRPGGGGRALPADARGEARPTATRRRSRGRRGPVRRRDSFIQLLGALGARHTRRPVPRDERARASITSRIA